MAATSTLTYQDTLDSQYLSSSLSSLSRSRSSNSLIVRTYKEATQLYLTKRFKEAFETLEPIITPRRPADQQQHDGEPTNGDAGGGAAPIAQSSKGTRTKVWVFYLSLLHALVDLGPEQGKLVFGSTRWRQLAAKAREGTVWEDIVQAGYAGEEGEVDADVVVNLSTLLLGHMNSQKLNQQRLECWLATSDAGSGGQHVSFRDGTMSPLPNGSSSPKALATRLKILELYALHLLPANQEWEYARQFIEVNDTLDEERKEAFTHALGDLRREKDGTAQRERELAERRDREMEKQRREEEALRIDAAQREEETRKAEEKERLKATSVKNEASANSKPPPTTGSAAKPTAAANGHHKPTSRAPPRASGSKRPPAPPSHSPPTNFYRRASSVLNNIQQMVLHASRSMTGNNSYAMFRFLMFMLAFLVVLARRDVRLRLRRMVEDGWVKVRRTVGIGVRVSYI